MTRLIEAWIADMEQGARLRDQALVEKTGLGLLDLAATAAGVSRAGLASAARETQAAAVPVTAGLGVIGGFAKSVAAIVNAAGGKCFATEAADVEGIHEAVGRGASLLFLADDQRFLAMNLRTGAIGENNLATAAGYAAALSRLARHHGKSLSEGRTLVLGLGPVGQAAYEIFMAMGVPVDAMDKDLAKGFPYDEARIREYPFVLEATPAEAWLSLEMLHPDVLVSAPGIPLGLDAVAAKALEGRLVHDMLDLGTAVMLAQALAVEAGPAEPERGGARHE